MVALLGNAGMLGFAYYFPKLDYPKETKYLLPVLLLIILATYIQFVAKGSGLEKIYNFTAHFYTFDYGAEHSLILLSTQTIALIILIRKTIKNSDYDGILLRWNDKPHSLGAYPIYYLSNFLIKWMKFISPLGKEAQATKSFSKAIFIFLIIAVSNVLNKMGIISYEVYAFIFANVTLVICFYILITYINHSPEPTTFMFKLVGLSLVTVLLVLGFVGNITLSMNEKEYDELKKAQIVGIKKDILNRQFAGLPQEIEYILTKPKDNSLFSDELVLEYNRNPSDLNLDDIKRGIKKQKDYLLKDSLTKVMKKNGRKFGKETPTKEEQKEALELFKKSRQYQNLVQEETKDFQRLYREAKSRYTHFDFVDENKKYEIGYSYDLYRNFTHQNTIKIIGTIFFTTILILLVFPRFFYSSLVKPLNDLLSGVTKVNEGNLDIEVPIKVKDEIGFLSSSFNSMVTSIKQARRELQDYAENLEVKVKERTREVREKMEEVQQLKIQQDGDYFLTSLLAKPLFFNANKSKLVPTEFLIKQKKRFEFKSKTADLGGDICITGNLKFGTPENFKTYIMAMNGDAMGKSMQGAGGSLVMGVVFNAIMSRSASNKKILNTTPREWLTDVYNEVNAVFKSFNGTMVISATVILVEEKSGEMIYFNAEHPATILYRDGKASFIEKELLLRKLGQESEFEFKIQEFKLLPGDAIIMGSDGKDDIDLSPNSESRTINEDENLVLSLIEKTGGNIFQMESAIQELGAITDDLSFLRLDFQPIGVREGQQAISESPVTQSYEEEELSFKDEDSNFNLSEVYQESKQLYREGKVNAALGLLMRARSLEPNNQKLNKLLGLMSFKGKDYATAVEVLSQYLQMDPDTEELWYYLSLSQKKMGRYLSSLEASKKVYELSPENVNNLVNLSDLNRLTGKYEESRKYSERALELDPDNQNAKKILKYLDKV